MVVLTDEVKEKIKEFADNHGVKVSQIKEQFMELYNGVCSVFPEKDGERAMQVVYALKAQLNASDDGGGETLDGIVLHRSTPKNVLAKKGTPDEKVMSTMNIVGYFKIGKSKELIQIGAFDEAIPIIRKIPLNKVVRINNIYKKTTEKYGDQYTFNNSSTFQIIDPEEKNPSKLLIHAFGKKLIQLEEMEYKPSENDKDTRLIKARVHKCDIFPSSKGNVLGWYNVYDDETTSDSDLKENPKSSTVLVQCTPSMAVYKNMSLCYFYGRVNKATKEYPASMWADLVVPIMGVEMSSEDVENKIKNAEARSEYSNKQKNEKKFKGKDKTEPISVDDTEELEEDLDLSEWGEE